METNPFFYRTALTKANSLKDRRVRVSWNNNLKSALNFWKKSLTQANFHGVIATEIFTEIPETSNENDSKEIVDRLAVSFFLIYKTFSRY